ncbi:hypothetical protein Slin15195_G122060 [Septoria linicola]|uniref:Secreted protein n=1 Tax=Septoria linicola TaxID=215465 RepID=A0A9Q9B7T7_9PEZI|nr:hypothetical protein Slin14017_G078270 [Septoria linicola]USW58887.1 hypothetical protein Slin15195_G122060 [Septoria linicola]
MRMSAGAIVIAFLGLDFFDQLLMTQLLSHQVLNHSTGRLKRNMYDVRRQVRREWAIVPGTCMLAECVAYWFAVDERSCTDSVCRRHWELVG